MEVDFDEGSVLYKETITDVTEGVGHFEPLRHYAEVHLILEPGSCIIFLKISICTSPISLTWSSLLCSCLMR